MIPHMKTKVFAIGKKRKKKKIQKKKFKMADSKKQHFSKPPILNIFFSKISVIGPWVSRID